MKALQKKYGLDESDDLPHFNSGFDRKQDAIIISGKEVEEVGFDKIRQQLADFLYLKIVLLDGLCMTEPVSQWLHQWPWETEETAARLSEIRETCPRLIELDLSRNLFEDLREVLLIVEQLKALASIKLESVCLDRPNVYH